MKVIDHVRVPRYAVEKAEKHIEDIPHSELEWDFNRWHPAILQLLAYIPEQEGHLADPQIVKHYPNSEPAFLKLHKDVPPEWANAKDYTKIVGVAITDQTFENGGVGFLQKEDEDHLAEIYFVAMPPGTIFEFGPEEWHTPGLNQTKDVRVVVYFRFVEE